MDLEAENRALREALLETKRRALAMGYTGLASFIDSVNLRSLDPEAYDRLLDEIKASVAPPTPTQWPTVEDATRRIKVLVDPEVETDMAARDLIVLMRELGRLMDENRRLREVLGVET